jgi:hypothetical protein
MGIKNYLTNIVETFPKIINDKSPNNIDIVCVDVNTILHRICSKSQNNEQFKKHITKEFDKIIKIMKPKTIALFTDGQAVLAKAKTQIKRRQKYLYDTSKGISTLNLTPGTIFMDTVDDIIINYLKKLDIDTFYSSSKENNEGEIKLFQYIVSLNDFNKRVCVVGDDSDIIVLALFNTPILNLYIYNNYKFLSLFTLVSKLSDLSEIKFNLSHHPIRKDFALLSLFLGNDYNKNISHFKNIFSAYKKVLNKKTGFLIEKNGNLNLKNIKKLFKNISHNNNDKLYSKNNVNAYFNSIIWNIKLYSGNVIPNYIPEYNINIKTILNYFPDNIKIDEIVPQWQDKNVYLLLLMPIVGKLLIPKNIQHLMNKDSPIKDLFPEPCPRCIEFKKNIKELLSEVDTYDETKYKLLSSELNNEYKKHLDNNHKVDILPIDRIKAVLNL